MMSTHVHVTFLLSDIRIQWHFLPFTCKHVQNSHLISQYHLVYRPLFTKLSLGCIILIGALACMEYEMESKYPITEPIAVIPSKWNQAIVIVNRYITIRNGDSFSVYKTWITPHSSCTLVATSRRHLHWQISSLDGIRFVEAHQLTGIICNVVKYR